MCVLHKILLVDIVEAPIGWGLLLHGEGGVGRGYLRDSYTLYQTDYSDALPIMITHRRK